MESETQTTQTTAAKAVPNVSQDVSRLLAVTMAVGSLLVIGLTLRDFMLSGELKLDGLVSDCLPLERIGPHGADMAVGHGALIIRLSILIWATF